jgi:alkylation response protein AidB-like acyl-CoA dehydrogenase
MLTYPDEMLSEEERRLRNEAIDYVKSVPRQLILDMDAEKVRYPKEFLQEGGRRNLLGLRFPKQWGGQGLPWTSEQIVAEETCTLGMPFGCLYGLVSVVGEPLNIFGTPAQKAKFLKPLCEGRIGPAEALTEPRGGSDFFGATTRAVRHGDYFILNGQKRFVVGSEGADLLFVYARSDPDAPPRKAISAFLVERGEGVTVEHVYGLLGARGNGTGRLVFRDAKVPVENVLGGEAGLGHGGDVFDRMMVPERLTSACGAVGLGRAALEVAARYASKRKAFGQEIRKFQAVSFMVADGITMLDAARALSREACRAVDTGVAPGRVRRMVSEAKKFSTESAWQVVNLAMQVLGGIGYTNVFPVERLLRDTRLALIWTGTNQIMNLLIQHEFYKEFLTTPKPVGRDTEADAINAFEPGEKVFE